MVVTPPRPGYVKDIFGNEFPAGRMSTEPTQSRKLLIVIPYYEGDRTDAEELASLMADLERVPSTAADVMLFRRFDAKEFSLDVRAKLETKFGRVLMRTCRQTDGKGYPFGPNSMFYDMVMQFGQLPEWRENYYAFINFEPDAVPSRPGWITEIARAFQRASDEGFACLGYIHNDPVRHLNGMAVYAIDIWRKVPAQRLSGGPPHICYDIYQAENLLPLACTTPLIHFEYKRPTISAEDLFNNPAAIFHGVKDGSARRWVRLRHVSGDGSVLNKTVFTYVDNQDVIGSAENVALSELWRKGWLSRGWNPVVLRPRDAHHSVLKERLPNLQLDTMPLLALHAMGGGLITEVDVMPAQFTPELLDGIEGLSILSTTNTHSMLWADRPALERLLSDWAVAWTNAEKAAKPFAIPFGNPDWRKAFAVQFSQAAIMEHGAGQPRRAVIEKYLRGELGGA